MTEKKAILTVSFGTSYEDTRRKTIEKIEEDLAKAYPGWEVRRAFTSGMIMKVLRERDGIFIDDVRKAIEKLLLDGFEKVVLQPTHIMNGDEYDKMVEQAMPYESEFRFFKIGKPLLTNAQDYDDLCQGIMDSFQSTKKEEAIVLMGHGTSHFADAAYAALDYRFKALDHENVFVGTVEGYPGLDDVLTMVKRYQPKKVILQPLMVVAGDHAINDMASDEPDSWKTIFKEAGYEVECVLKGLGEFEQIRQIYLNHIKRVMDDANE